MARRQKKSLRRRAQWMLLLCVLFAVVSFCLPWVAVPSAVIVPRTQTNLLGFENTLIDKSFRGIYLFSLSGNKVAEYTGYRLPVLIWKTESNQPGKLFCLLTGKKHLRYRGLALYLYPVLLAAVLLLMRKRRYRKAGKWIGIAVCGLVCWVQFVKIGLCSPGVMTMNFYLDYGFWLGAVSFLLFGVSMFLVRTT